MKKNSKNKNIKILITSLLCSLAFTYVNVNAMKNNNSEGEQLQISKESNNNTNVTNNNNENKESKSEEIQKPLQESNVKSNHLNEFYRLIKMQYDYEIKMMAQNYYGKKNDGNEKEEDTKEETNTIIDNKENNDITKIKNSDSEKKQQQSQESNTKSNPTHDFDHLIKINDDIKQGIMAQRYLSEKNDAVEEKKEDIRVALKEAQKKSNKGLYVPAKFWVIIAKKELNNASHYLDEETKKYYGEEIAKLNEEIDFNEKKDKIIENLYEYSHSAYDKLRDIYDAKTKIEKRKKIDLTIEHTDSIANYIKSNKKYLNDDEIKDHYKNLKCIYEKIEEEIIYQFNESYKEIVNYLEECNKTYNTNENNRYFDDAIKEFKKIDENKEKYRSYLSKENKNKIDDKIKELETFFEDSIKKESINISFENCLDIPSLLDLSIEKLDMIYIKQAWEKIETLEKIINKDFSYLTNDNKGKARIIARDNQIEIWKDEIKTNNETIQTIIKRN